MQAIRRRLERLDGHGAPGLPAAEAPRPIWGEAGPAPTVNGHDRRPLARAAEETGPGPGPGPSASPPPPAPEPTANGLGAAAPLVGQLTPREREVGVLIASGLTNAQIARKLVVTNGTVANHVAHILSKLGCRNRAQVAVWFVRAQLGLAEAAEGQY
jgi:DNA-binding CsgD family transcriptional regulator